MNKRSIYLISLLLFGLAAMAQDSKAAAPKYLWIETDTISQGAGQQAYIKMVNQVKEALSQGGFHWLTEYPIGGNANQVVFVGFLDSGDAMEKAYADENKVGEELVKKDPALWAASMGAVANIHFTLAKFEPGLSIALEKLDPPKLTRSRVTHFVLRPGGSFEFEELLKEVREMHLKANDGVKAIVYRIIAGGSPGFLVVVPMNSLADLDTPSSPAFDSMLTPTMKQHIGDVLKANVETMTTDLFVIDPALSRPPDYYVSENPGFWKVAEQPVATTAKKGKAKPAAMKEKP